MEKVKTEACNFANMFYDGNDGVKSNLLKGLLWNVKIQNGVTASAKYKMPYEYLKDLNNSSDLAIWRCAFEKIRTDFAQNL